MVGLFPVLSLSAVLFCIGVAGVFINRRHLIVLLLSIELILLAASFNFIAFSRYTGDVAGQVFVLFVLTIAAAESAIGLALLVLLFHSKESIEVDELTSLKG